MNTENIIGLIIYLMVALVMLSIGIVQLRSKRPVGFYSGETPPKEEDLTDMDAWNKKHGWMWVIYSALIMLSFFIGLLMGDTIWSVIPMCGGILFPVLVMIWYDRQLRKRYIKKEQRRNS